MAATAAAAATHAEADLRSATGASPACTHRFRNERAAAASIFWLDYEGRAVRYGEIPPGGSADQGASQRLSQGLSSRFRAACASSMPNHTLRHCPLCSHV